MSYPDEWNLAPAITVIPRQDEALRLGYAIMAWREWALSVPEIAAQGAEAKAVAVVAEAYELLRNPGSMEEMADIVGVISNACPSLAALAQALEEKLAVNRTRTFVADEPGWTVRHVEQVG